MSRKKGILYSLGALFFAGVISVAGDVFMAWQGTEVKIWWLLLGFVTMSVLLFVCVWRWPKRTMGLMAGILGAAVAVGIGMTMCWISFQEDAVIGQLDEGKQQLFAENRVMVIVPHQDDEINVLGGALEEFVYYGSEVYLVCVTNGDFTLPAQTRFQEMLDVAAYIGIPSENLFFLGYGDTWDAGGPHIYNGEANQVVVSVSGRTATYGTPAHEAFREERDYTVNNYLEDMEDVILQIRPDLIFCSDYDDHIDHKAVTLAFEKVMGKLLKENPQYRPRVFKGYAYNTAWYAQPDFWEMNINSTENIYTEPYHQTPETYRWETRLRLPVGSYTLSRSLVTSGTYHTLMLHESQNARYHAASVINGDKVVWYRDTNSLCLDAEITAASGRTDFLNDFMILENTNLVDNNHSPYDGVWIPTDDEKKVQMTLSEPSDIKQITLYDHPSPEDNVSEGIILFEDGTQVPFGPLHPGGAATDIAVDKKQVSTFAVVLTQTEGATPGLAEIEAYAQVPDHGFRFLKLVDKEDNYVYDYWILRGQTEQLGIVTEGVSLDGDDTLEISWDNKQCKAELLDKTIQVEVPKGENMILTVKVAGTNISDTVCIRNPGMWMRFRYQISRIMEEWLLQNFWGAAYQKTACYKLLKMVVS